MFKYFVRDLWNLIRKILAHTNSLQFRKWNKEEKAADFFKIFQPLLQIGATTGLIPLSGTFSDNCKELKFNWSSIRTFLSLGMTGFTIISFIPKFNDRSFEITALQRIFKVTSLMYYMNLIFIYVRFWIERHNLINLVNFWIQTDNNLHFKPVRTHSRVIIVVLMGLGVAENLLHNVLCASEERIFSFSSQKYLQSKFVVFLPSSSPAFTTFVALLFFICDKLTTYSWNLVDLIIVVMCRALTNGFRTLRRELEKRSRSNLIAGSTIECSADLFRHKIFVLGGTSEFQKHFVDSKQLIKNLTQDFLKLRHLTQIVSRFLSPLFTSSYSFQLLFISIHINRWLMGDAQYSSNKSAETNPIGLLYIILSSTQFIARAIAVTYFAAEINHEVHQLLMALQNNFPESGRRLERIIKSAPVGIDVFGMFVITRGLLVSIISFMFSFQIVLLQTSSELYHSNDTAYDKGCSI